MTDFDALRTEYDVPGLERSDISSNPFVQFRAWLEDAAEREVPEPNAFVLATSVSDRPTARAILLKRVDHGFVFFTNYRSDKGQQIAENPLAAMCFAWLPIHRQVRIEGTIERISGEDSDAYFASRPRGAQIASAASPQSRQLADRAELQQLFTDLAESVGSGPVVRPAWWGGFRLVPDRFEFWQGQRNRLHDRFVYELSDVSWAVRRLAP